MKLPHAIEVNVSLAEGEPGVDLLVALDIHHAGRYYFGTLLGLTDRAGGVRADQATVVESFTENQRLFPMDYRVPLSDCDALAVLRIEGGKEFTERQASAVDSLFVTPATKALWRTAKNAGIQSSEIPLRLDETDRNGIAKGRITLSRVRGVWHL